jgi:20S proteasome subunit beta 3
MDYNGGTVVVMGGKDCFAIASDFRLGLDNMTLNNKTPKIFKIHEKLFLGTIGLLGDISTLRQILEFKNSIFTLRNSKKISPFCFSNMLSNLLYENRFSPFLVETILIGFDERMDLLIESKDMIGASSFSPNFSSIGSSAENLYGLCEVFWRPEMNKDELFVAISNCLILALNRNCISGWGGIVHLVTNEGITTKLIKTRMD